jgi:hypothetical protein
MSACAGFMNAFKAGLPDLPWWNITKREKYAE